jgi:HTH-type transcriptional regulator/antitoxin HipB
MGQLSLAQKVGVSRQWIVAVEKGKPRAEVGLIFRTLAVLGIRLTSHVERQSKALGSATPVDLDAIVAAARIKRRK